MSVAAFFVIAQSAGTCSPRITRVAHSPTESARAAAIPRRHVGELVARDLVTHQRLAARRASLCVLHGLPVRELRDRHALAREIEGARSRS